MKTGLLACTEALRGLFLGREGIMVCIKCICHRARSAAPEFCHLHSLRIRLSEGLTLCAHSLPCLLVWREQHMTMEASTYVQLPSYTLRFSADP